MIYTAEETRRCQTILAAFEDYIAGNEYFDILYSPKCGYIHVLIEKDEVATTLVQNSDDLFEWLITEVSNDVRNLFLCGQHDDVDLFPEEIQESRIRLLSYIALLPKDLQPHFAALMEFYFKHCNDRYKDL